MRLALPLLALALSAATPAAAEVADATVRGFVLHCDATLCRGGLPSTSGKQALLIGRFGAGDGIALGIATPGAIADRTRPMTLRIDGRRIADLEPARDYAPLERVEAMWIVDDKVADTVVAALDGAKAVRFEYIDVTGAPFDADFDVSGFREALAWTDVRLGRTTKKPTGATPQGLAAAPTPTRGELVVKMGVPPRLFAKHVAASTCEAPGSPLLRAIKPVIGILSPTAIVYAIPCTASAGNVAYRLWVVESGEIGGITPLYFAAWEPGYGWKGTDLLHNVEYDEKTQRLTSTFRSGPGCGLRGVWRWKKWTFAMDEMRRSDDCGDGRTAADWPKIYSAEPAPAP
jgi:hypothetical protein